MENIVSATVINNCEICGAHDLPIVLNLGRHPLCDDLVPVNSERLPPLYPIEVLWCSQCGTAHQKFQVPKVYLFPPQYHYRARFTANVLNGMRELVESCEAELGTLQGKLVLDVGCNDGSLLSAFGDKGARTIGVEPTDAYMDAKANGHDVENAFFTRECAEKIIADHGYPDIVTFTNVFAHIENLPQLVDALRVVLGAKTTLVIENHYLGSVLDKGQFDTFYHEHPRTYSLNSFIFIARLLNRKIIRFAFPARYGGNIRVFIASKESASSQEIDVALEQHIQNETDFGERLKDMERRVTDWSVKKRSEILELVKVHGPLPAKSFPGRAAILIKLLGLGESEIQSVYEKPGSMKIGHFVPGTRIQIRSDDEFSLHFPVVLNLAWHISDEITYYLRERGFTGKVVNIYSPTEL
jgi:SAM-dependent methyltransferase